MAALPKQQPHRETVPLREQPWEEMADPVHPMHQELLRRVSQSAAAGPADADGWSGPARMAAAFYLGLACWGVVVASVLLIARLA